LQRWLESALSLRGDGVLRLKGIVWLRGETRPIVLRGVHHVLHPPVYLDRAVQRKAPHASC
jgi:G3E family GTPase